MADRLIRAQVSIPMDSGLPEDVVVNTLYFDDDDDPVAAWSDSIDWCHSMLTAFYQAIDGEIFPTNIAANAIVKYYDMREAEPRVPKDTRTIALTPSGSGPLPHEVALCLSFKADTASGQNPRRRRGRIYLGPLNINCVDGNGRMLGAYITAVANAAAAMENGVAHPGSPGLHCKWAVYSPTTDATSSVDDAFNDVTEGWVDNAFDTQRRRGIAASSRTTWT